MKSLSIPFSVLGVPCSILSAQQIILMTARLIGGLVNSGIIKLKQTVGLIPGANPGTAAAA